MNKFIVKSTCVFFISVLISIYVRGTDKKTVYYFTSADKPKREITRDEYISIAKGSREEEYGEGKENLSQEEVFKSNKAVSYGASSFAGLMIILSILELRNKNK